MFEKLRYSPILVSALLALFMGVCLAAEGPATVTGKVIDEAGKPLGGVTWEISGIEQWDGGEWTIVFTTGRSLAKTTGEDGKFEIAFLGKVRYDLQFDKYGYGPAFLYQVSPETPEVQVVMKEGSLVQGVVTRSDNGQPCREATIVVMRLPNPRGTWFKKSTLVDHDGRFKFFASPPSNPPMPHPLENPIKWQVICAGEVISIDVVEGKPVDEIHFEVRVRATTSPARKVSQAAGH
jgi:hypothetical protein